MACGRFWGGRKIQAQLSKFRQGANATQINASQNKIGAPPPPVRLAWKDPAFLAKENPSLSKDGWIVKDGDIVGARLSAKVISEGKEAMRFSLVGFLKD